MAKKIITNTNPAMPSRASFWKGRKMLWGFGLHGWENMMIGMLFAAGMFAVLVGVSTFIVVKLQRVEIDAAKDELDRYKSDVAKDISKANERAAEANKIAESERLARLKLEEKVRPRTLSPEQQDSMLAVLKAGPKGPIYVHPDWMNPEARIFGSQIEKVFAAAGFETKKLTGPLMPLTFGIMGAFLVIRDGTKQPPHLASVLQAFRAIGYEFVVYAEPYVPDTDSIVIGISAK
jgi:hypothetical protein